MSLGAWHVALASCHSRKNRKCAAAAAAAARDPESAAHTAASNVTTRGFEFHCMVDRQVVELDPAR
jgi:hypothetical protein